MSKRIVILHHPADDRLSRVVEVHLATMKRYQGHAVERFAIDSTGACGVAHLALVLLSPDFLASGFFGGRTWHTP